MFNFKDTIVALSTAKGTAAIALIRLSGPKALEIVNTFLFNKKFQKIDINKKASHTNVFALFIHNGTLIDEVLVNLFRAPKSYTGDNCVEVACHGSVYIQQQLLQLFLVSGARMAQPGEFTLRAFMNRKLDLSQAEAVADLIASQNAASHQMAMMQMRGGYSNEIKILRTELINFASLIELELDFSEEDVEFANRQQLITLLNHLTTLIAKLLNSFDKGNVIKNGVPVAIVGKPNSGKSTLLNALLQEERAIVSEIAGTTRDTIEDEINIEGIAFRFIDTAGLRNTNDEIEKIGINRSYEAIKKAAVVIYLFDVNEMQINQIEDELPEIRAHVSNAKIVLVANKIDTSTVDYPSNLTIQTLPVIYLSAKQNQNVEALKIKLLNLVELDNLNSAEAIVTNARHANSLKLALENLMAVKAGIVENLSGELLAQNIRSAINELGSITGEVSSNDLLANIFGKFCIGK